MAAQPLILLTNDDGIRAPGLLALYEVLALIADIEVVAPETERSAASHAVTIFREMAYRRCEIVEGHEWHSLDGMPADCVKLALSGLLERKADIVVSGINPGANISKHIHYSGTVAAAREGTMFGIPSVAVSMGTLHDGSPMLYDAAARFAARLVPMVLQHGLPPGVALNVNVPNLPESEIEGVTVTRQGDLTFIDDMQPSRNNGSVSGFTNVGKEMVQTSEAADFDNRVLGSRRISVTPLRYDLTDHGFREELANWFASDKD